MCIWLNFHTQTNWTRVGVIFIIKKLTCISVCFVSYTCCVTLHVCPLLFISAWSVVYVLCVCIVCYDAGVLCPLVVLLLLSSSSWDLMIVFFCFFFSFFFIVKGRYTGAYCIWTRRWFLLSTIHRSKKKNKKTKTKTNKNTNKRNTSTIVGMVIFFFFSMLGWFSWTNMCFLGCCMCSLFLCVHDLASQHTSCTYPWFCFGFGLMFGYGFKKSATDTSFHFISQNKKIMYY